MFSRAVNRPPGRRGLTLIELVVVLVILIALAGIIIPALPSMLGRAETGSGATNHLEITKWIQTYEQLFYKYPGDWDALVDEAGNVGFKVRGGSDVIVDATGLTQDEADALKAVSISRVQKMYKDVQPAPWNATFYPYKADTAVLNGLTIDKDVKLLTLALTGQVKLGLANPDGSTKGKFVVFGFGKRSEIIGKVTSNAPIVFRDDGSKTPDLVYCRYGVVFQVSTTTAGGTVDRARFVGVCNFKGGGVFTSDDDIQEFHNLNLGGG